MNVQNKMNYFEISMDQHMDMIEYAGNKLDKHDLIDCSAPSLVEVISIDLHKYGIAVDFKRIQCGINMDPNAFR